MMAPVVAAKDDDNKTSKFCGGDFMLMPAGLPLPCQLCPGSSPGSWKGKACKCSVFLVACFIVYQFMGLNAIPHLVVFSYMFCAATRMMANMFCNLANSNEDLKKKEEEEEDKTRAGRFGFLQVFKCPFKAYSLFLFVCFIMYRIFGGHLALVSHYTTTWRSRVAYTSCVLEGFGLISLMHKVGVRGHVRGLSGMSVIMFALTYTMREIEAFVIATVHWHNLDDIFIELLQISTMLLSYKVLWDVFKTYRKSYEADLDVCQVKYLIPGCLLFALVLHPEFRRGSMYSASWAASFYIDVLALLPQVVMMQRGDGIVEAPIAHFVAATFISRTFDFLFWYDRWHRGDLLKYLCDFTYSGGLIALFFLLQFALVGDFMYYYFKWRLSAKTCDHIEIPEVAS